MAYQVGSNFKPVAGYTMFLDASIPESYVSGSGNTWNNLAGSNNCTMNNGASYSQLSTGAGTFNFNGSNQYGVFSVINLNGAFTMMAWVKKNETSSNGRIFGGGWIATNQDGAGLGVSFGVDGATLMADTFRTGGIDYAAGGTITAGKWHHVAAVQNPWTISLYLDGVLVETNTFYNNYYYTTGGSSVNYIGANSPSGGAPGGSYWNGSIAQFLIYNGTMLSQKQLVDHFNQTKARFGR